MKKVIFFALAILLLVGCGTSKSATQTSLTKTEVASLTEADTPTAQNIPTDIPKPTDTSVTLTATQTVAPPSATPEPPSATPEPSSTFTPPATLTFADQQYELGDRLIRPGDKMVMVFVPAGTFMMGSLPDDDQFGPHTVTLDGFWIDQTEVTNAQFADFLNARGNQFEGGINWLEIEQIENAQIEMKNGIFQPEAGKSDYPAVEVSWFGIFAYCEWVGARLPTEAEWEYAARGPENHVYPWGDDPPTCSLAQFGGCGDTTVPVGNLNGDSWVGAKDMVGNVWEWTSDYYAPYPSEPQSNPTGPENGDWWDRAIRGGSYLSAPDTLHTAYRMRGGGSQPNIGFRCAVTPPGD